MRNSRLASWIAVAIVALAATGCGSSSKDASTTTTVATTASPATTSVTQTTAPSSATSVTQTTPPSSATSVAQTTAPSSATSVITAAPSAPSTGIVSPSSGPVTAATIPTGSTPGITIAGDLTGPFALAATGGVTCVKSSPPSIVLNGTAGGHRGTLSITFTGTTDQDNLTVVYLPDGAGGAQYVESHIPVGTGNSRGLVTLNADGSGKIDVFASYVPASGSFNGQQVHITGTWTC